MIPTAFLQAWSTKAPWPDLRQVEQDLIICRAPCGLFNAPALAGKIAFRGGMKLNSNFSLALLRVDRRRGRDYGVFIYQNTVHKRERSSQISMAGA